MLNINDSQVTAHLANALPKRSAHSGTRPPVLGAVLAAAVLLIGCAGPQVAEDESGGPDGASPPAVEASASTAEPNAEAPAASRVSVSQVFHATPAAVWAVVGSPAALADWHPAITQSPVTGDTRTCTLGDGATVEEKILRHSDAEMSYTYRITASPLPFRDYDSTISVKAEADGARVTWVGEFVAVGAPRENVEGMVRGLYEAGMQSVAARLDGGS